MEIKILQVFYGKDGLPYKDKDRQVHFPIAGTGFLGASNTTKIKFYYDELDNLDETTWVAVSKLPNGKVGSRVLESHLDSKLNEHYALLELDNYYTQYKGDVFISLQGYQGGVDFDYDEENSQYEIHGTPTISATGSIKFTINYANQFVGSGETDNINFQRILAAIGTKLGIRAYSEHVEELPSEGSPDVFYVVNDDPNHPNLANIYIWNGNTRHYIWVGDNKLNLGDYYTKQEGEQFEQDVNNQIDAIENEVQQVASGSPKGVYATLAALQAAYPTGANGIYVVSADGHWYYWNGTAWTDGGVYQSAVGVVPETRTIAGLELTSDITKNQLQKALDSNIVYTINSFDNLKNTWWRLASAVHPADGTAEYNGETKNRIITDDDERIYFNKGTVITAVEGYSIQVFMWSVDRYDYYGSSLWQKNYVLPQDSSVRVVLKKDDDSAFTDLSIVSSEYFGIYLPNNFENCETLTRQVMSNAETLDIDYADNLPLAGWYNSISADDPSAIRLITNKLFYGKKGLTIRAYPGHKVQLFLWNEDGTQVSPSNTGWATRYTLTSNKYFRFAIKRTDGGKITIDELKDNVFIYFQTPSIEKEKVVDAFNNKRNIKVLEEYNWNANDWQQGLYQPSTGLINKNNSTRISSHWFEFDKDAKFIETHIKPGYKYKFCFYFDNGDYVDATYYLYDNQWQENANGKLFIIPSHPTKRIKYFNVSISKNDNTDILPTENTGISIRFHNFYQISDRNRLYGKKISILGDSISTFAGIDNYVQDSTDRKTSDGTYTYLGNVCRYPQSNLLTNVNDMYWVKLIKHFNMVLGVNDSIAGSRVAWDGSSTGSDVHSKDNCLSSQTRIDHLDDNGTPDIIMIYGGTNDITAYNSGIISKGTFNTESPKDYTDTQIANLTVTNFADAYRAMLIRVLKKYQNSKVVVILPNYTNASYPPNKADELIEIIKEECDYFGVNYIDIRTSGITLFNLSKYLPDGTHPNQAGMDLIYQAIKSKFNDIFN